MKDEIAHSAFTCAYVACGYLLGNRGDGLLNGIDPAEPARRLCQRLQNESQAERARALARELTDVASALSNSRVW